MLEVLVGAVVGAIAGGLAAHFLPGLLRFASRRGPLDVHVEDDPAIIWAGAPPWIGAMYVIPPGELPTPPGTFCPEWWSWARSIGGVDANETHLRVSLVGATDLTVVVDGLRARVHDASEPTGQVAVCAAGGADITSRHFQIRLDHYDPPSTAFVDQDGRYIPMPAFKLAKGEVEMLHVVAYAEYARVEWTGELLAVVNGKRQIIPLRPSTGGHFITSATEGLEARSHIGDGWSDPEVVER